MNSMTIITHSFDFMVHVCSMILDEMTHAYVRYLYLCLHGYELGRVHPCTFMYVCVGA